VVSQNIDSAESARNPRPQGRGGMAAESSELRILPMLNAPF